MTGVAEPPGFLNRYYYMSEYIRKEETPMTVYEIISTFIGILALLISFGGLIIAVLTFLDKRNKRK